MQPIGRELVGCACSHPSLQEATCELGQIFDV